MNTQRLAERAATLFDLTLTLEQLEKMGRLSDELIIWNERVNLTRITDEQEVETKHFLDSLSLFSKISFPNGAKVVDVGTGAGFPGFPIKIVRPDLQLSLIESVGKKTNFLSHIAILLELQNVSVLNGRAEDLGQNPAHRERYDVVVARALAHMPVLVEYLLPLCKVGGIVVAMKGESAEREAQEAAFALKTLGGKVRAIHEIRLPDVEIAHYLITVEKIKATPKQYPRLPGTPAKTPLLNP